MLNLPALLCRSADLVRLASVAVSTRRPRSRVLRLRFWLIRGAVRLAEALLRGAADVAPALTRRTDARPTATAPAARLYRVAR